MNKEETKVEKLQSKIEQYIVPFAMKLSNQRHLAAIRDGLTYLIPFTIIGGISILIASPPIDPSITNSTNVFINFMLAWKTWATANSAVLMVPYNLSIGIISIYVVAGISFTLADRYKLNAITNSIVATFIFATVACAPQAFQVGEKFVSAMPTAQLGASAMFSAIIIAILVVEINNFLIKKDIKIKMPSAVPANISAPFEAMIPLFVSTILVMGLNVIAINLTGSGLTQLIFVIFQPLLSASSSLPSILLITILTTVFWFFGIHGNNMVSAILTPITTANITLNLEAYTSGNPMKEIFAGSFNSIYGGWMTYAAVLAALWLVAKSSQLRAIRKVTPVSTLFNVNEPLIFGIPTVLNVYTFIGITLANVVNVSVAYFAMASGLVGKIYLAIPWTTPAPLAAFLSTMDWKATVLWFLLFAVDIIILLPFITLYDKQLLKAETSLENE